ncbi:MAG: acyl-ACP--UDP-N-acetylglucosamine O-acyltransferase [Planctomycetota bacterium]|nr:acyl-ACP--UDP-N-acetylglucosamine O-acyltransferase [Planctomycetota bacterium]
MTDFFNIHPTAIIDPSSSIDASAMVGPYCVIGKDVVIGEGTILLNHVTVQCNTSMGSGNKIFPYTVIGGDPQDKKYAGEETTLMIGDDNEIREHVTIHRGTGKGGGTTVVGNRNLLMVGTHVAHDCILGNDIVIANQVMLAGHIHVDDCATVGGGAGINQFSRVGRCAYVGGLARITKDVPPYMIVEGTPAEARAVNVVAMSRRGYSDAEIEAVKDGFKRIFKENGSSFDERIQSLSESYPEFECVQCLCDAMKLSSSGKHGRSNEKNVTSQSAKVSS